MDRNIGLWVDHKQAFLIRNGTKKVEVIDSKVKSRTHFSGGSRIRGTYNQRMDSELHHDDYYKSQLDKYYTQIILAIHNADSIFIMGPGEAKLELKRALQRHKDLRNRLVKVEKADKMTINQMIAHVRLFYENTTNN